ncbi:CaiB/BaiF CoA transferase family protein [Mycolicibacterium thermoresistibile]|uniref:Caib/baif family protein n=2 Tax=Mycolicibacterium thermoresistibile TaxID=1797 RepID=G7CN52_MYCT3|nr:CoA transferase [Mycolicibacterium thermoresistibile]EHI10541.1 caib/baif family protein [Mycolicibacterium thermoresistibile ATCC 19527]MCV7189679.1 CoA transferase [Mycolicibacterium thermoresistibile]GAT15407.1 CaiB/baiF CoA-transferase family protein [Mycolicibacterium thermoresistibile]SNW17466.1 CaiB/baiF CoA-transferase family protein [Mycolicibacterium thermoresistibile]
MSGALAGVRVVEVGTEISAPYCTKLLADLGADVHKIEPPDGDPLRQWGPFPGGRPDPDRSGLFDYLNCGKTVTVKDFTDDRDRSAVRELIAGADILVENLPAGDDRRQAWGLDSDTLARVRPGLVVVRISDFGQHGPLHGRPTSPLTMQAASGWVNAREFGRTPVQAGARIPEYIAGGYAALGALTGLRVAATVEDRPVEVDVSTFEALLSTLPYPMLLAERLRSMGLPTNSRAAPMLGIVRAADGWIGINCLTGQHWLDVCAMVGLPEFGEHQLAIMLGGPERDEFLAKVQPWLDGQSVADIVELSQALRIPAAPVNDGSSILTCPQYAERGFFVPGGGPGWEYRRPGAPFRLSGARPGSGGAAEPADAEGDPAAPFAGLKVFDLSTFWAGAYLTCYLGAFGADVVKVESIQRPDAHRYSGALLRQGDDWYERGPLWQGTNLNKRDLTLDLNSGRGRELALRLAADADVVVENFSPRVVEQFGLDYDSLAAGNPDVIMVRMPGFGLAGPWRDYVGWALNIEQLAGMSAVTGYPDGPPCNLQGPADPIAGVHAGVALLAALHERRRTGGGQLIEVAQIEVGAAVTAEPVIEYSMNGVIREREGNRHRSYAQGVYPCRDEDDWVAISVRDDTDWANLVAAMDLPGLARDERFRTAAQRRRHHDEFDDVVSTWTRGRTAEQAVAAAIAHGVPAERILTGDRMYDLPQLDARGYYEEIEHPITGTHRYPGWPFRISPGPARHHRTPPPTLGQHNTEILRALGVTDDELGELADQRVIGRRLLHAD